MGLTLLYRISLANDGLVFAFEDEAKHVARLHKALNTSRTWGEFRERIPHDEYSRIVRGLDELGEPRPKASETFSAESVPGWSDGDYPPWLQAEMDTVLPDSLLREFGTLESTHLNGNFWMIPQERGKELIRSLRRLGFRVISGAKLPFY